MSIDIQNRSIDRAVTKMVIYNIDCLLDLIRAETNDGEKSVTYDIIQKIADTYIGRETTVSPIIQHSRSTKPADTKLTGKISTKTTNVVDQNQTNDDDECLTGDASPVKRKIVCNKKIFTIDGKAKEYPVETSTGYVFDKYDDVLYVVGKMRKDTPVSLSFNDLRLCEQLGYKIGKQISVDGDNDASGSKGGKRSIHNDSNPFVDRTIHGM